jgi:hypothetical protein
VRVVENINLAATGRATGNNRSSSCRSQSSPTSAPSSQMQAGFLTGTRRTGCGTPACCAYRHEHTPDASCLTPRSASGPLHHPLAESPLPSLLSPSATYSTKRPALDPLPQLAATVSRSQTTSPVLLSRSRSFARRLTRRLAHSLPRSFPLSLSLARCNPV